MIKIVTVYNSLNPGSFLQATTLYDKIKEKYGNDICFLNTRARHPHLSSIKLSLKLIKELKIKYAINQLFMSFKYSKLLKKYKKSKIKDDNDIYILGSDEIWNVKRKQIAKYKIFFCDGLNNLKCISYSPSINNSKYEDFEKYPYIKDNLKKIDFISVRDNYSKRVIEQILDKEVKKVCDPTMLMDIEYYKKCEEYSNYSFNNYIFIYGSPKRFTNEMIFKIKEFAKKKNKKLISYYFKNNWCDKILYGSPYDFLTLIDYADYVITNTFHGTLFSIMYNKKFTTVSIDNNKISELLNDLNIDAEYDKNINIEEVLNKKYDYDKINIKISELRTESEMFLFNAIKEKLK